MRRPALPRASSAMSGFFFCGSIDEPVAYASASRMNPNSSVDHSTISSPMRERWICVIVATNSASATKSRSETASSEFWNRRAKPSSFATKFGSSGKLEPASAPAPSGETSARSRQSRPPVDVACQCPEVREQVVRQQDRLGALEVREAGQRDFGRLVRAPEEHLLQRVDAGHLLTTFAAHVQPQVECDLVVAAAAGVQLGAGRPRDLRDAPLDRGVDVFVARHERERAVGQFLLDAVERGDDHRLLLRGEQPDAREHRDVRARAVEVVAREPVVERQADRERE